MKLLASGFAVTCFMWVHWALSCDLLQGAGLMSHCSRHSAWHGCHSAWLNVALGVIVRG